MSAVCSDMFRHLLNFLYLKCQEEERSRAAMCPLSKRHGNPESLSYTLLLQSYLSIFVGVLIHFYAFLLFIQRLLVKENMYVFHWTISRFRRIEKLKHFLVKNMNPLANSLRPCAIQMRRRSYAERNGPGNTNWMHEKRNEKWVLANFTLP